MNNPRKTFVCDGDLFSFPSGAVVIPVNKKADRYGKGVDGLALRKGGSGFQNKRDEIGTMEFGQVAYIEGPVGEIQYHHIFLVCTPPCKLNNSVKKLHDCYLNVLKEADKRKIDDIYFPVLGSGGMGFEKEYAFDIADYSTVEYLCNSDSKIRIHIVKYNSTLNDAVEEERDCSMIDGGDLYERWEYLCEQEKHFNAQYQNATDKKAFIQEMVYPKLDYTSIGRNVDEVRAMVLKHINDKDIDTIDRMAKIKSINGLAIKMDKEHTLIARFLDYKNETVLKRENAVLLFLALELNETDFRTNMAKLSYNDFPIDEKEKKALKFVRENNYPKRSELQMIISNLYMGGYGEAEDDERNNVSSHKSTTKKKKTYSLEIE